MTLTSAQLSTVLAAARALPLTAVSVTVESFFGAVLSLTTLELAAVFPDPDPQGIAAIAISELTNLRDEILREECEVPTFVIFDSPQGFSIAGLCYYYDNIVSTSNYPANFTRRLTQYQKIRAELVGLDQGHKLETIAAAVLEAVCLKGEATKGSGDQGIDAFGENDLIPIDRIFLDGEIDDAKIYPGQKVIVLASSKANLHSTGAQSLISPAHIRELIGGWLIQRSEVSMWKGLGIQMLTPLQLLLVTTYRLSEDSKALCNRLGVQVWGIPEMTFLICRYGPDNIFAVSKGFSSSKFSNWWQGKELTKSYPIPV